MGLGVRPRPYGGEVAEGGSVSGATGFWVNAQVSDSGQPNDRTIYGGDPCPRCGLVLGWDEDYETGDRWLIHPEPQCGWIPSGYPSTRAGAGEPPSPSLVAPHQRAPEGKGEQAHGSGHGKADLTG